MIYRSFSHRRRICSTCYSSGIACEIEKGSGSTRCLNCRKKKRRCNIRDEVKQLRARRAVSASSNFARTKITSSKHVNELGVGRDSAITLGQLLSVKKRLCLVKIKMEANFAEVSERLDRLEAALSELNAHLRGGRG